MKEKSFFDSSVKNDIRTYHNIQQISTGQGDNCAIDCLLCHYYFQEHYKMIATDLGKQKELYSDPKGI